MAEPSGAEGWPEVLGVSEPSEVLEPPGVLEPLGVSEVPEPSRVSEPSEVLELPGVLGASEPLGVPGVLQPLEPPGVPQPSGVLQPTPPPELLEELLSQRFGPLPRPATIARLRRGPAGDYEPTEEPAEVLERRQAANAKERERIRNLNSCFSQLRMLVPLVPQDRRPSKVDTLRAAAQYIRLLRDVLRDCQKVKAEQALGDTGGASLGGPPETWPGSAPPCPWGPPLLLETAGTVFPDIPKNPGGPAGVEGQAQGSSSRFQGHAPVLEPRTL